MNWSHLIVHHTGAEERNAQQIREYHRRLGWQDIGYHYIIERDGRAVPGRSLALRGAHCLAGGMNHKALGIAVIGNLEKREPFPGQWQSLTTLLRRLMQEYRIPLTNLLGHREVPKAATVCPGQYMDLAALRQELTKQKTLFRVQVGAFQERKRAEMLAAELELQGYEAWIWTG